MTRSFPWRRLTAGLVATILATGCQDFQRQREMQLERQRDEARTLARQRAEQIETLSEQVRTQRQQIKTLQALGEKRLDRLFTVAGIQIGRHSGGVNQDEPPGQDAVKIFLSPTDAEGHVLKAAGDVKVQLYDLAMPKDKTLYAEYAFPVDTIGEHWSGGLLANHYSFLCPWPNGRPPAHSELTLRVEFTDYLTGRSFDAQKAIRLDLPPAALKTPRTSSTP